ncbi:MAG: di-trans,poly-cis-decaprenylcistransferase [Acidimicrobiia bacterium]|nr:di-trans,poly-cis-decaprenylcistransferase [Acidimicrobiia bacterium]
MSDQLDPDRIPRHIGIIMDGNGRWANARGFERTVGHAAGEQSIFDTIDDCLEFGVEWLTVYAFSTENWNRSAEEVDFLMAFNESLLVRHRDSVAEKGVRLHFIGLSEDPRVPQRVVERMAESERVSAGNTAMHVVFAFNYGGRAEIAEAARAIAEEAAAGTLDPASVEAATVAERLYLPDMPEPELVIRTSGEQRLSNFLLWQSAYSELVFTPVLWPDFDRAALIECLLEYQGRDRRFGGVRSPEDAAEQ